MCLIVIVLHIYKLVMPCAWSDNQCQIKNDNSESMDGEKIFSYNYKWPKKWLH
jgi:hypothetical protein